MPDQPENPSEQDVLERLKRAEEALRLSRIGSFTWRVATDGTPRLPH